MLHFCHYDIIKKKRIEDKLLGIIQKKKIILTSGAILGGVLAVETAFADQLDEHQNLSIRSSIPYSVWNGGNDIERAKYEGGNRAVAKLFYKKPYPEGGPGSYFSSHGTGTFISPNVMITVGHNYLRSDDAQTGGTMDPDATFYYNLGTLTSSENEAWVPSDGVTREIGKTSEMSKHFHHKDTTKFYRNATSGSNIDWQYDFALTVVDEPMQFTSPDKEAEPLDMVEKPFTDAEIKDMKFKYAGYGSDFSSNNKDAQGQPVNQVTNPNIQSGQFLSVKSKVFNVIHDANDPEPNGTLIEWHNSSFGGFSGSSLRTMDDKIFGVLQAGGSQSDKDSNIGLAFNQQTLDWIKGIVKQHQIKGWRDHNGHKYYFQDNGHLYRNTTQAIDGRRWQFDKYGVATDIGTAKKGSVAIDFLDTDGKKIVDSKTIVKDDYEGTDFKFDTATDPVIKKLVDSGEWKLKQVDDGSGKKDINGVITGKVGEGAKTIKLYFERLVYTIDVEYAGTNQKETLNNGGKGWKIGEKVKVKPKAIPGYFTKDTEKEVTIGKTNKVVFNYTKETNIEALKRGITDAKGALNQDFTEGRYKVVDKDTRISNLNDAVKRGEGMIPNPNAHKQTDVDKTVTDLTNGTVSVRLLKKQVDQLKALEKTEDGVTGKLSTVKLKNRTEDTLKRYNEAKRNYDTELGTSIKRIQSAKDENGTRFDLSKALQELTGAIDGLKYKDVDKSALPPVKLDVDSLTATPIELEYLSTDERSVYEKSRDALKTSVKRLEGLPLETLQEEFDKELDSLKLEVEKFRAELPKVKQRIEEEKIRRIRAEYKELLQSIQDYRIKSGSKNEGLLASLSELESELRTGSDSDLKSRIAAVRMKFDVVKAEDAKTQEIHNFSFETLSARRLDVSLDEKAVLGKEVIREETGKDGTRTVDVTSKLGKVTGLVVKGEEAKRLRLVLGTRHDAKLLRLEGERFVTRKAKAGELKREGVTGIVEVWQMGDEVVKLEVRRPVDRVE